MLATAFEQMADRAKREVEKIRRAFIKEICQAFGVHTDRVGVKYAKGTVTIVTDQPDNLTKEVNTIAEAWREAFDEEVRVVIVCVDCWLD